MQFRLAVPADIAAITRLQNANLYAAVDENERAGGFLTTPFSDAQLQAIIKNGGAFVAQIGDAELAGYALVGPWDFYAQWPIFPFMTARVADKVWNGVALTTENTFQYGPVCVAREWRGRGVLPPLFQEMRRHFAPRFSVGMTFINRQNARSLGAHRKLGMEIVDEFSFEDRPYFTLAFLTREP